MFDTRPTRLSLVLLASAALSSPLHAQQANDVEYTAKIKEYLQDPRISTELVDHLPASATVPTPLTFMAGSSERPVSSRTRRTSRATSMRSPRRRRA